MSQFDTYFQDFGLPALVDNHTNTVTYITGSGSSNSISASLGEVTTEEDDLHGRHRTRIIKVGLDSNFSGSGIADPKEGDRILVGGEEWVVTSLQKTSTLAMLKTMLTDLVDRVPVVANMLRTAFTVTRISRSSDGQGGETVTYAAHSTNPTVIGNIRPASLEEREVAQRMETEVTHVAMYAPGVDLLKDDRVTWTDNLGSHTADVQTVATDYDENHIRVELQEIREGQ